MRYGLIKGRKIIGWYTSKAAACKAATEETHAWRNQMPLSIRFTARKDINKQGLPVWELKRNHKYVTTLQVLAEEALLEFMFERYEALHKQLERCPDTEIQATWQEIQHVDIAFKWYTRGA